jgi:hypothetical protein
MFFPDYPDPEILFNAACNVLLIVLVGLLKIGLEGQLQGILKCGVEYGLV